MPKALRALSLMLTLALISACSSPTSLPSPAPTTPAVMPEEGVRITTPKEIIWVEPGTPPVIMAAPRKDDKALTAQARRLGEVAYEGTVVKLEAAGDWVAYTVEQPIAAGARQVNLAVINLAQPDGSTIVGSVRVGREGRFTSSLGPNLIAWQSSTPEGRYKLGETHVLQLQPSQDWAVSGVGWAERLRLEGDTLVAELPGGALERHPLHGPESEVLARADLDGDGQLEIIEGQLRDRPTTLRVKRSDGTVLWDLTTNGEAIKDWLPVTGATVADLGGPRPVLVLQTQGGSGGVGLVALAWDSGRLAQLAWNGEGSEFGYPSLDPVAKAIIIGQRLMDPARHLQFSAYQWREGQLSLVERWVGPRPELLSYPTDPTFVLLAAFNAVAFGLDEETPRYFVDPAGGSGLQVALAGSGAPWVLVGNEGLQLSPSGEARFSLKSSSSGGAQVSGSVKMVRQGERWSIAALQIDQK